MESRMSICQWRCQQNLRFQRRTSCLLGLLQLAALVVVAGAATTPTVPAGFGPEVLPGPFPDTLSGVQFSMTASGVSSGNGTDTSSRSLSICGQGPVPWTAASFQQGAIAARLSASSNSSLALTETGPGVSNNSIAVPGQTGWSPSTDFGVLLATVTANGMNWTSDEAPFYPVVAAGVNSSSAGYDMRTGQFTPGGTDIVSSKAGQSGGTCDADVGAVWFPFSEGWMAASLAAPANVSAPAAYVSPTAYSANLPAEAGQIFTSTPTGGHLTLPGVRANSGGLLFAVSTVDTAQTNGSTSVVSVAPQGVSWTVQIRSDVSLATGGFAPAAQSAFSFLYLPFGYTENLIGGHVDGVSGTTVFGQGASVVSKVDVGQYQVRLMKPRNRNVSCSDGVLLLQTVGLGPDGNTSDAVLSYAFQGDGSMLVQARTVAVTGDGSLTYNLTDTDFYFAWVDFLEPIHPAGYGAPSIVTQQTESPVPSAAAVSVLAPVSGPSSSPAAGQSAAGSPSPAPSAPLSPAPVGDQPAAAPNQGPAAAFSPAPAPSPFAGAPGGSVPSTLNRTAALLTAGASSQGSSTATSASLSFSTKVALAVGVCVAVAVLGGAVLIVVRRRRIRYPKISLDLTRMNSLEARRMKGIPLAELGSGGGRTSATDFNILQV
ncbi:hypothetical protein KFL_000130270 [Klebsormidium nitens]|uniref:Uncharacterized protein n=1 Tax=Klebsormidium nitens TaxID=105231 RepID=A0A1Y1HIV8_KLENI|nr:hypothetical protein KFL_000130270 [Klebsormidium nitens]|eukprot:GAQ78445.1 hypothetical protein KFL_000130270 [Klebsormidium nitens]